MDECEPDFAELEKRVLKGSPKQVAQFLANLKEKQRKKLAGPTYKLYRRVMTGEYISSRGKPYANAPLAVVGTCPYEKAKRAEVWTFSPYHADVKNALIAIFLDRRPKWVGKWIDYQLQRERMLSWKVIDALLEGGFQLDMSSDAFARFLGGQIDYPATPLSEAVKQRPYLLDHVWRLFEVDSQAFFLDLDSYGQVSSTYETWPQALAKLSQEGLLERGRLLDSSLAGLTRDFSQNIFSGLIKFVQRLEPSEAEVAQRQAAYLELLASPSSRVVNFALKFLRKHKQLDAESFFRSAAPALSLPTKGTAVTVLKMIKKLAKRSPELAQEGAELAAEALIHSNLDVRELAIRTLEELPGDFTGLLTDQEEVCDSPSDPVEFNLEGIEEQWLKLFGFQDPGLPTPMDYSLTEVPFHTELLQPFSQLQELIDAVARAVEQCVSGDEVERILDGLSRMASQRPPDFKIKTAPLLKRIKEYQIGETIKGLISGWGGCSWCLRYTLLSWLEGKCLPPPVLNYDRNFGAYPFLARRLAEISARVGLGVSAPLLAFPTHRGGWIEPSVFVARLSALKGTKGHRADLIAGLLRLLPRGRQEALKSAGALAGVEGRAVRWALGGAVGPGKQEKFQELWLAAAHCRRPGSDHTASLGFPSAPVKLSYRLSSKNRIHWSGGPPPLSRPGKLKSLLGVLTRQRPLEPSLMPTRLCYQQASQSWQTTDNRARWTISWLGQLWPSNLQHFWSQAAMSIADRLDLEGSLVYPNDAFLEPLFETDRPWTPLSQLTLWLALLSKDSDLRGVAIDAFIEGIEDGRAHHQSLSAALIPAYRQGSLKVNRLAQGLLEIARAGELQRWTVAQILSEVLAQPLPKGAHHLLEALLQTADSLPQQTRSNLESVKGKSKQATLAGRLLKLKDPPALEERARRLLLNSRLERARRWSSKA